MIYSFIPHSCLSSFQSDITELVNHRKAELQAKHAALQAAAATEAKSQVRVPACQFLTSVRVLLTFRL